MESKAESEAPAVWIQIIQSALFVRKKTIIIWLFPPTNSQKVLDSVKECALYGDSYLPEVNRRLQIVTEEELMTSKATWHRICYQQTANKELIRRAKERYERRKSDLGAPTSA